MLTPVIFGLLIMVFDAFKLSTDHIALVYQAYVKTSREKVVGMNSQLKKRLVISVSFSRLWFRIQFRFRIHFTKQSRFKYNFQD